MTEELKVEFLMIFAHIDMHWPCWSVFAHIDMSEKKTKTVFAHIDMANTASYTTLLPYCDDCRVVVLLL